MHLYNGQEPDQDRTTRTTNNQNQGNNEIQTVVSTPTTESNMDFIDKAYEEHVMEKVSHKENDTSAMGNTPISEDKQKHNACGNELIKISRAQHNYPDTSVKNRPPIGQNTGNH